MRPVALRSFVTSCSGVMCELRRLCMLNDCTAHKKLGAWRCGQTFASRSALSIWIDAAQWVCDARDRSRGIRGLYIRAMGRREHSS